MQNRTNTRTVKVFMRTIMHDHSVVWHLFHSVIFVRFIFQAVSLRKQVLDENQGIQNKQVIQILWVLIWLQVQN